MTETKHALALPNSAVLNMAPGANLSAYIQAVGGIAVLSAERERELAERLYYEECVDSARELVLAHLRFVVHIARSYSGYGLSEADLIQEGNVGLMKAVKRFDPTKGSKLSTYSAWWIKQAIKRSLANQSKTIRLPVHLVDKISKLKRTALKLQEALGREPTDEELGEEMEMNALKVARLRRAAIRPASLDSPIGDDNSTFAEIVSDEKAENPYKQLEDKTINDMLYDLIKTLPHREATILEYRFGLDGGSERTLEEVGEHFNVTRERVRQIQNLALSKLRKMIEKMESVQK